jgi:hypothetical protein
VILGLMVVSGSAFVAGPALAGTAASGVPGGSAARAVHAPFRAAITARAAAAYWTPQRMRNAKEATAPVPPATTGALAANATGRPGQVPPRAPAGKATKAAPAAVRTAAWQPGDVISAGQQWNAGFFPPPGGPQNYVGKVFFTNDQSQDEACTGAVMTSASGMAVLTAGHCVVNAKTGHWFNEMRNWVFVPGYSAGWAPHDFWVARELWTTSDYLSTFGDPRFDMGAAVLTSPFVDQRTIQHETGSMGVQWNMPKQRPVTLFGYPGKPEFDGEFLIYCQGTNGLGLSDGTGLGLLCNEGHGSSGGPWLADFDGQLGSAHSIVIGGTGPTQVPDATTVDWGPYFDNHMAGLWSAVQAR